MVKRARVIVTGLLAIVLASSSSGCAQPRVGVGARSTHRPDDSNIAAARASFSALVSEIYGSAQERDAGERLNFLQVQTAISSCMASRGKSYPVAKYDGVVAEDNKWLAPGDLTSFAPVGLGSLDVSANLAARDMAGSPVNPGFVALKSDRERRAYASALNQCQNPRVDLENTYEPNGLEPLVVKFVALLTGVEMHPEIQSLLRDYPACMRAKGFGIRNWDDMYSLVQGALVGVTRSGDVKASHTWQAAAVLERRLSSADTSCRTRLNVEALVRAMPGIIQFRRDHAQELASVSAGWTSILVAAVKARAIPDGS